VDLDCERPGVRGIISFFFFFFFFFFFSLSVGACPIVRHYMQCILIFSSSLVLFDLCICFGAARAEARVGLFANYVTQLLGGQFRMVLGLLAPPWGPTFGDGVAWANRQDVL